MNDNNQKIAKRIGNMIAKHRKQKQLTQAQLAEKLDISTDAMSRMERGGIMPTVPRLIQLAEILECETADFLTNSSPLFSDQLKRMNDILAKLEESEREGFLDMVENMVAWHLGQKK